MTFKLPIDRPTESRAYRSRMNRSFLGNRRGGAILEAALVMPVLIALSFGTAEYGYFFFVKNIIAGAARDGVRAAVPSAASDSDVTLAVQNAMSAAGIQSSKYTVTLSPSNIATASQGSSVSVTVTAVWGTVGVTPLPTSMGGISVDKPVTVTAIMRKES